MNNEQILLRLFNDAFYAFEKIKNSRFEFLHKIRVKSFNDKIKQKFVLKDLDIYPKLEFDYKTNIYSISFYFLKTKIKLKSLYLTDNKRIWVINNENRVILFLDKKKGQLQKEAALFLLKELKKSSLLF
jgi:hypothetical protein